jgi:hypothetical protein
MMRGHPRRERADAPQEKYRRYYAANDQTDLGMPDLVHTLERPKQDYESRAQEEPDDSHRQRAV